MTGFVPAVLAGASGRSIAWIVGGVLALLCALSISGGSAWMIWRAGGAHGTDDGLLQVAGLLLALMALFVGGLGWLALDHGRNLRLSGARLIFHQD